MRGIVKIDTIPRSSSGSATRYASQRDRHPKRESTGFRPLFTPDQDGLKWTATDTYLTGRPGARPRSSDLQHIIFAFDKQDARDLDHFDKEDRDKGFRLATRAGMKRILDRLKVRDSRWAAVVHRHTKHTHVHVLLSKLSIDAETGQPKRISRFPQEMLNSRDPRTSRGVDGLINLDMAKAIDQLLGREKRIDSDGRDLPTATNQGSRPQTARFLGSDSPSERPAAHPGEKKFSPADPPSLTRTAGDEAAQRTSPQLHPLAQEPQTHPSARHDLLSHLRPPADDHNATDAAARGLQSPELSELALAQKVCNPAQSVAHFLSNPEEITSTRGTATGESTTADRAEAGRPDVAEITGRTENPVFSPLPSDEPPHERPDTQPSPDLDDFIDIDF